MIILLISGCNETNETQKDNLPDTQIPEDYIPSDIKQLYKESNRNRKDVEDIISLLENTAYSNYNFKYQITINDKIYNYEGQKFQSTTKGIFNDNIKFQQEENQFYNPDNKEKIDNVFSDVNYSLTTITEYMSIIENNYTCIKTDNIGLCESQDDNIIIEFEFDSNFIKNINYQTEDTKYILEFTNFDNVDYIPLINYDTIELKYTRTNQISKEEINDSDLPYTIYNYYVDNATCNIENKTYSITNFPEIFNLQMYYIEHKNTKDENILNVGEYIYENDFIIIRIDYSDNVIYYLSTTNYSDEILKNYLYI